MSLIGCAGGGPTTPWPRAGVGARGMAAWTKPWGMGMAVLGVGGWGGDKEGRGQVVASRGYRVAGRGRRGDLYVFYNGVGQIAIFSHMHSHIQPYA